MISHILVNIFIELRTVELELHRRDLSDHSPSETDASLDVLVKILCQMPRWCEHTGRILSAPLFPLPEDNL